MRLAACAEARRAQTAQGSLQTSAFLRDPVLCECGVLSELEDIQKATPVVAEIGVYFAYLLCFCLVLAAHSSKESLKMSLVEQQRLTASSAFYIGLKKMAQFMLLPP